MPSAFTTKTLGTPPRLAIPVKAMRVPPGDHLGPHSSPRLRASNRWSEPSAFTNEDLGGGLRAVVEGDAGTVGRPHRVVIVAVGLGHQALIGSVGVHDEQLDVDVRDSRSRIEIPGPGEGNPGTVRRPDRKACSVGPAVGVGDLHQVGSVGVDEEDIVNESQFILGADGAG